MTLGAILEIEINKHKFCYAQILTEADCAFFDYIGKERLRDLSVLETVEILFIVAVYQDVITNGKWIKVGKLPIRDDLKTKPMKFIQDAHDKSKFELYNPNNGKITKATKEECQGLEYAAVWEAKHVEERLEDHYNNKPNIWVERMKIK